MGNAIASPRRNSWAGQRRTAPSPSAHPRRLRQADATLGEFGHSPSGAASDVDHSASSRQPQEVVGAGAQLGGTQHGVGDVKEP